jgi:hypothetical protein
MKVCSINISSVEQCFRKKFFFFIVIGLFDNTSNRYISTLHRINDSTIAYADLEIIFLAIDTTINNIHLSIEVESNLL